MFFCLCVYVGAGLFLCLWIFERDFLEFSKIFYFGVLNNEKVLDILESIFVMENYKNQKGK